MTIIKGVGFLSSICGALILLEVENFEFKGTTLGNFLIVLTSLTSAANALVQKHVLNQGAKPLVVQVYVCVIGAIGFMIGYAPFGLLTPSAWQIPPHVWLYISIVGIVASAIPWSVGIIALKNTSPMTVSVYVVLQPPVAAFVGVVLMGETLTLRQFLGSALVLLGLFFVNADPLVRKVVEYIRRHIFGSNSKNFTLLPSEDKEEEAVELKELNQIEPDGAGATVESVVEYNLATIGETNDFVIMNDAKPDTIVDIKLDAGLFSKGGEEAEEIRV